MSPQRNTLSAPSPSTGKSARSTAAPASPPNFSRRSTISPIPTMLTRFRLSSPPTSSNSSRQPRSPTLPEQKSPSASAKSAKSPRKTAAEPSLSHDGKKLLYTRPDNKTGPDRTIVLYDTTTGRSQDLVHGGVREAFWSPDDARVAYLNFQDQKWQLYIFTRRRARSKAPPSSPAASRPCTAGSTRTPCSPAICRTPTGSPTTAALRKPFH